MNKYRRARPAGERVRVYTCVYYMYILIHDVCVCVYRMILKNVLKIKITTTR